MAPTSKLALTLALSLVLFGNAVLGARSPAPSPAPAMAPSGGGMMPHCPMDALKMRVCANVLNLVKAKVGVPPNEPCCTLLHGMVDLDAAACLCTAVDLNVLGIPVRLPTDISAIINGCGKSYPSSFICPVPKQ